MNDLCSYCGGFQYFDDIDENGEPTNFPCPFCDGSGRHCDWISQDDAKKTMDAFFSKQIDGLHSFMRKMWVEDNFNKFRNADKLNF